jgi:protein SCO1/2
VAGGWPIARAVLTPLPPPLPLYSTLPEFLLTDQFGEPRGAGDLRGRVWVAGFVFTRCPSTCPVVTATMLDVQRRAKHLGNSFRLVSISVDPAHDTPERLAEYAQASHVRPQSWFFLTGDPDVIRRLVVKDFKLALDDAPPDSVEPILHSTRLVLVDQKMGIRGYYDSTDPAAMDNLLRDAGLLANRGP